MRTRIVKIGNSQGIRIPKPLIEEAGLEGEVEITLHDKSLVITPASHPRDAWAEAFKEMSSRGDDSLINGDHVTWSEWDKDEWEWE
jgi:antitoxin MazE